ncbi:integrase, partial [Klebsiella pneumoniae]|nr:integrase [Klebsiella pneumoniae]
QHEEQAALQKVESVSVWTVEALIELYLTQRIEDRITPDGKRIPGVRKLKGQKETRRLLVKNVVPVLGHRTASQVTR